MALDVPKRSYTEEEVVAGLNALLANGGRIRSTAREIGVPVMTVSQWASQARRVPRTAQEAARRADLSTRNSEDTIRRLNEVIPAALDRTREAIPSLSGYQAMLVAAIAIDKRQLLSGGATSRSEQVRTRYVDGDALHSMAARVIDLPALGSGLSGGDRTPKVAGGGGRGSYLTQSPGSKGKKPKRAPRRAVAAPSLRSGETGSRVREVGSVTPPSE